MAFVFYDTETTGTEVHYDQILQFAAILTDDELNEVERFEVRSRLQPHIVAGPGAMNVTGVTAAQLDDASYPSQFEMACQIHEKLSAWGPAQFVGHNSISFDEVLLRSLFYKSLLPIYLTNMNGSSRIDTLKLIQSVSIYEPDGIVFPVADNGRLIFKLDQLAPANGFDHANAHEAMSDVEATIFMFRKVREVAPETWSRFMRFSNKGAVLDFCESEEVFGLTEFYFGTPYTYMLHKVGVSSTNENEVIAVDLNFQPEDFEGKTDDELRRMLKRSPKPLRRIKANALPGLMDAEDAHQVSRISETSLEDIASRALAFQNSPDTIERLLAAHTDIQSDYEELPHIEERIYDGFPSPEDSQKLAEFHEVDWPNRFDVVCGFSDPRFRALGEFLIFTEAPQCLNTSQRDWWTSYVEDRLMGRGEPCKALTLPKALEEANDLMANAQGPKLELLTEHRDRLAQQLEMIAAG